MVRAWLSLPLWLLALWIIAMTACTSMGSHNVLARSDIDFGPADDNTSTHGYAVVQRASVNQLFMSPTSALRHEIYHLLGCSEHFNMSGCYETITAMKRRKRDGGSDFFPAWDGINERTLVSRDAVNARLLE